MQGNILINNNLAAVFPGQGSQAVGMLADINARYAIVRQTFAEAAKVLGYDLWALLEQGPAEKLNHTIYTQPALLTASFAIWRILQQEVPSFKPAVLAGHSLGEYTALVCANALAFEDAVNLVAARAQYMQEAVTVGSGGMAAIVGLDDQTVTEICSEAKESAEEVLEPANFNSIGQVVIAGHIAPLERAIHLAKRQGARLATLLPVSVPSHCLLMRSAAQRLSNLLTNVALSKPTIPIIRNTDVSYYTDKNSICDGLVKQLYTPVRWVETIQHFSKIGIVEIIECGPGKVLSGLNKRINQDLKLSITSDLISLQLFLEKK